MAGPIEIAFSVIRNHPAVRNLKALEKGIYFALVQACLLDGINPLPYDAPRTMAHLAGATSMQWARGKGAALKALDETLLILEARYQARAVTKQKRAAAAKVCLGKSWDRRKLASQAKVNALPSAHNFVEDSYAPVILQPTKATRYRPNDIDMLARQNAINQQQLAKNDKSKAKRLTDKF